jgi:hypothetical protein
MDEIKPILEIFVNNASSQKLDGSVKDALAAIHAKMTSSVTFQIPTDVSSKSPFVNVIAAPRSTNEIYTSSSLPESIIPKLPRR